MQPSWFFGVLFRREHTSYILASEKEVQAINMKIFLCMGYRKVGVTVVSYIGRRGKKSNIKMMRKGEQTISLIFLAFLPLSVNI